MINIVFIFAVLWAPVFAQKSKNSLYDLVAYPEELKKLENLLDDPNILKEDVCCLTDDKWEQLKPVIVKYAIDLKHVNYDSGTFNLAIVNITPKLRAAFYAAQCDEEYNLQPDMDSKILAIRKGYYKRIGNCGDLPGFKEACKINCDD